MTDLHRAVGWQSVLYSLAKQCLKQSAYWRFAVGPPAWRRWMKTELRRVPPWRCCRRQLLPARRCRPLPRFPPAGALLHAASRRLAGASRFACPTVRTAPVCGAGPHGYLSYVPLRLTVGLNESTVNANPGSCGYGGNAAGRESIHGARTDCSLREIASWHRASVWK